jgi:hypothetical protein
MVMVASGKSNFAKFAHETTGAAPWPKPVALSNNVHRPEIARYFKD